jgi:hypothetical protein
VSRWEGLLGLGGRLEHIQPPQPHPKSRGRTINHLPHPPTLPIHTPHHSRHPIRPLALQDRQRPLQVAVAGQPGGAQLVQQARLDGGVRGHAVAACG